MMVTVTGAELHDRSVVVDCHNDLILLVAYHRQHGRADYFRERCIPELRRGGVDVQVVPIFIDDQYRPEGALRQALSLIEIFYDEAEKNADAVSVCMTGDDLEAALSNGKIALVLALEGCEHIGTNLELFGTFYRLGVRMASFTHFGRTMLADGSAEDDAGSRLTHAGVEAVAMMQRMGMLVDVSHLSLAGTDHVLEIATRPIIASHSNARSLLDHHRNLPDDRLKAIASIGGVVGVNFFWAFLAESDPKLSHIVDQVERIAEVAGIDHVGLGPDFVTEYFETTWPNEPVYEGLDVRLVPEGTTGNSRDLPLVTAALLERGFYEDDVVKVLGANFMRVFRSELGTPAV
jgi:membrane dipeptidase